MVLLQPCRTTAAYEAIPEGDLGLDLGRFAEHAQRLGWEVLADAGVMLVVRRGPDDASVFRSGKLLIKTRDRTVAERVWTELSALYPGAPHGR